MCDAKKCLFLLLESIEDDWQTQNRKFRMSSWGELGGGKTGIICLDKEILYLLKNRYPITPWLTKTATSLQWSLSPSGCYVVV